MINKISVVPVLLEPRIFWYMPWPRKYKCGRFQIPAQGFLVEDVSQELAFMLTLMKEMTRERVLLADGNAMQRQWKVTAKMFLSSERRPAWLLLLLLSQPGPDCRAPCKLVLGIYPPSEKKLNGFKEESTMISVTLASKHVKISLCFGIYCGSRQWHRTNNGGDRYCSGEWKKLQKSKSRHSGTVSTDFKKDSHCLRNVLLLYI